MKAELAIMLGQHEPTTVSVSFVIPQATTTKRLVVN